MAFLTFPEGEEPGSASFDFDNFFITKDGLVGRKSNPDQLFDANTGAQVIGGSGGGSSGQDETPSKLTLALDALNQLNFAAPVPLPAAPVIPPLDLSPVQNMEPNVFEQELLDMSRDLLSGTEGIRNPLIQLLTEVAGGSFDPTTSATFNPLFATAKKGVEDQFNVAKKNIMANLPVGGALNDALAELEMERAGHSGSLTSSISTNILDNLLSEAFTTGFGAIDKAQTGLGTAGQTFSGSQNALTNAITAGRNTDVNAATAYNTAQTAAIASANNAALNAKANLFNTNIAGLFGLQRQQMASQAQESSAKKGGIGQIAGMAIGAYLGGPAGASIGASIGGSIGGAPSNPSAGGYGNY